MGRSWTKVWLAPLCRLMRRELLKPTASQRWERASLLVPCCRTIEMHRKVQRGRKCSTCNAGDLGSLLERCLWRDWHHRHHVERTDAWVYAATIS
jgi:hypothetical protein